MAEQDFMIPAAPGKRSEPAALRAQEQAPVQTHETKPDNFDIVEKILKVSCMIGLLAWFVVFIVLAFVTGSAPFDTMVGLSPLLLTIVVTYVLVDRYHMESGFLMVFPFVFTGLLLLIGYSGMVPGLDFLTLSAVNIVLGLLFEALLVIQYAILHHKEKLVKVDTEEPRAEGVEIRLDDEESVKRFVSSIEDKAKAINSVIGRVYGSKKGGSESVRKKLRIDASHYNELSNIKEKDLEKRKAAASQLVRSIRESLLVLERKEREVFDKLELRQLDRLIRDESGDDRIIDVLTKNDSDPVKSYYDGAVEFCESALKQLGEPVKGKYKGLEALDIS